jgi:hypothetical protein
MIALMTSFLKRLDPDSIGDDREVPSRVIANVDHQYPGDLAGPETLDQRALYRQVEVVPGLMPVFDVPETSRRCPT